MTDNGEKQLLIDGKRLDGRELDELRPMKIESGNLKRADGSCYLEMGNNKIVAAVYGPREVFPRHMQDPSRAIIRYRYSMAPFSVDERKRPGPDRRSLEISKVSREAFDLVVMKEFYPKSGIDVFVEVLQADAGTRTACINAATVALVDAGIAMKGMISSVAVGKIDGKIALDLFKDEDNEGEADVPFAFIIRDGEIKSMGLIQMDGKMTYEEIKQGVELAKKGALDIYNLQRDAILQKYSTAEEVEE
ncbi:MAG: exosome complex exonuclease Rrp41 [Archaeoglobaceae archaeon]